MYATYLRLDISVHDGWRAVIRAAAKKLAPHAHRCPAYRSARHRFYREILVHHQAAQQLVRSWRL